MTDTTLEFVNDWSELENCVNILSNWSVEPDSQWVIEVIAEYVPRLLTQYANLVELSFALTEGWEEYVTLQGPTGLYLPDHR